MAKCPRCLYEYHEWNPAAKRKLNFGEVYAHDCVSGYIRSYPAAECGDCFTANKEFNVPIPNTYVEDQSTVTKKNRKKKLRHFKEMGMTDADKGESEPEAQEA